MVKITFKLWEEVIIHESIKYSLEDLIRERSIGLQPGGVAAPLKWAKGVAFHFVSMPPTDEVVREQLQGKIHWQGVEWALMPNFKNVITIDAINAKVPVVDVSANPALCQAAEALKARR